MAMKIPFSSEGYELRNQQRKGTTKRTFRPLQVPIPACRISRILMQRLWAELKERVPAIDDTGLRSRL